MLRSYKFAPLVALALTLLGEVSTVAAQPAGPVAIKQHTEAITIAPPPAKNHFLGNIVGGAALNSGNTRSYTVTLGGHLEWVHHKHQLMFDALGLVNAVKPQKGTPGDDEYEKIAANVVGRGRYDLFLSDNDALFLAAVPRRDIFAGLNIRLQMQAGYSRNLFAPKTSKQRLWGEAGYDLTYDDFSTIKTITETKLPPETGGAPVGSEVLYRTTTTNDPGHEFVNSARAFLGYTNSMTSAAVVSLGAEFLFDVTDGKNVRVNTLADFTTSLSTRFKIGFVSRMFFDNVPVPGKKKTDFVSTFQLIYTYDSLEGIKADPTCNCEAEVKAATQGEQAACAQKLQGSAPVTVPSAAEPAAGSEPAVTAPVQTPTTTTTPSAPVTAPTTAPATTTPVTAPTAPQAPVAPPPAPPPAQP